MMIGFSAMTCGKGMSVLYGQYAKPILSFMFTLNLKVWQIPVLFWSCYAIEDVCVLIK